MKTIPGKIIIGIDNKVYFEPDELPKPSKAIYNRAKLYHFENLIIQKYEASKQLVEVENDYNLHSIKIKGKTLRHYYKNNQNCKAEIKDNKATIISLTKE